MDKRVTVYCLSAKHSNQEYKTKIARYATNVEQDDENREMRYRNEHFMEDKSIRLKMK